MKHQECLLYALPYSGAVLLFAPKAILQGIYATYYGMSLTSIASVIFITRVFDAVADVFVGRYADRIFIKHGSIKAIIAVGALLLYIAGYFLYIPPDNITLVYFLCWSVVFYLGWTLFDIPHQAWASRLARETTEKSKIFGYRTAVGYSGITIFYVIPLLPFFDTTSVTPETLKWSVISSGVIFFPALYFCIKNVPYQLQHTVVSDQDKICLLYTSPSPRDQRGSRMPSSA